MSAVTKAWTTCMTARKQGIPAKEKLLYGSVIAAVTPGLFLALLTSTLS